MTSHRTIPQLTQSAVPLLGLLRTQNRFDARLEVIEGFIQFTSELFMNPPDLFMIFIEYGAYFHFLLWSQFQITC